MLLELVIGAATVIASDKAYTKSVASRKFSEQVSVNSERLISITADELESQKTRTEKALSNYKDTQSTVWNNDIGHFLSAFRHFRNVDDFKKIDSIGRPNPDVQYTLPDIICSDGAITDFVSGALIACFPVISIPLINARSNRMVAEAKAERAKAFETVEKMEMAISMLKNLEELAFLYNSFVCKFCTEFYRHAVKNTIAIYKAACEEQGITPTKGTVDDLDFRLLSDEQKRQLYIAYNLTDLMCGILSTPLYNKKGEVNKKAVPLLQESDKTLDLILAE